MLSSFTSVDKVLSKLHQFGKTVPPEFCVAQANANKVWQPQH